MKIKNRYFAKIKIISGVTQLKFIFYLTAKIAKVSAKLRKDISENFAIFAGTLRSLRFTVTMQKFQLRNSYS